MNDVFFLKIFENGYKNRKVKLSFFEVFEFFFCVEILIEIDTIYVFDKEKKNLLFFNILISFTIKG